MILIENLLTLFLVFVLFLFFCSIGLFFLALSGIRIREKNFLLVFSFATGVIFFSIMLLFLGKNFLYNREYFLGITLVLGIFSLSKINLVMESLNEFIKEFSNLNNKYLNLILFLIVIRVFYSIFNIFLPPAGWDSLAYHFAIPAIYLKNEKITYIPFMYHSNWPQNMEIIFGYAIGIWNDYLAQGICFLYAMMLLLTIFQFSKTIADKNTGLIALAIVISTTLFKRESVNGYVDVGLSYFFLSSLFSVYLWTLNKDIRFLMVGAICAGGAASVKILGLFSLCFLPLFIIFSDYLLNNENKKLYIKQALWFFIFAVIIACPWYIKSLVDTGNPVWPFAYSLFKGKNWSEELANYRDLYYKTHGAGNSLLQLFFLPYNLIKCKNMDGYLGNNFIFYYFLFPFLIFHIIKEKNFKIFFLLIYSLVFMLFWFFSTQMIRFLFPGFVVITILNSFIVAKILFEYKNNILKVVVYIYLIFLILYSFPFKNKSDFDGIKIFSGFENREKYLEKNIDSFKIIKRINSEKLNDGKIALLKEVRGYYFKKDYIWADPVNQGLITYKEVKQTINEMKKNNIKYILLNSNQYNNAKKDGYTKKVYNIIDEIIKNYSKLLYCESNVCFYEIIK